MGKEKKKNNAVAVAGRGKRIENLTILVEKKNDSDNKNININCSFGNHFFWVNCPSCNSCLKNYLAKHTAYIRSPVHVI